jgi:alpha-galactosidase
MKSGDKTPYKRTTNVVQCEKHLQMRSIRPPQGHFLGYYFFPEFHSGLFTLNRSAVFHFIAFNTKAPATRLYKSQSCFCIPWPQIIRFAARSKIAHKEILYIMQKLHLILFLVCLTNHSIYAQQQVRTHHTNVRLEGATGGFKSTLTTRAEAPDVDIVTLALENSKPEVPGKMMLKFAHPSIDIQTYFHPAMEMQKQSLEGWEHNGGRGWISSVNQWAPVLAMYNLNGENRLTVACSDIINPVWMQYAINEYNGELNISVELFHRMLKPIKSATIELRLDYRNQRYTDALAATQQWWRIQHNLRPAPIPEAAKSPVYSTWCSYHEQISDKIVEEQCRLAKSVGCDMVIVDDGWQSTFTGPNWTYAGFGDFTLNTERFPDFEAHIRRVKAMDMKYMLWFAVPFIGDKSMAVDKMKDKALYHLDWGRAYVMDPRFPEVRTYFIDQYVAFCKKYPLDGLKLDFIDIMKPEDERNPMQFPTGGGRDYDSLEEAVDRFAADLYKALTAINPDMMLEFRQNYIGPKMSQYGNMFRAIDGANGAIQSRIRILDMRNLGVGLVHSDMVMWHPSDPVESAALQIQNAFWAVPQVSVLFEKQTQEHRDMVAFLLGFWKKHRDLFLEVPLKMDNPDNNYLSVSAQSKGRQMLTLYAPVAAKVPAPEQALYVVNATRQSSVTLHLDKAAKGKRKITIQTCTGKVTKTYSSKLSAGLHQFEVPPAGVLSIE